MHHRHGRPAEGLGAGLGPLPFTILIGVPASFATPIGYQTSPGVYGPGGYRSTHPLRIGLPLNALLAIITVLIAPRV